MKIEKGKLYYETHIKYLHKATYDDNIDDNSWTDKIAVYCPTKEDWDYACSALGLSDDIYKRYKQYGHGNKLCVSLDDLDYFIKGCAKHTTEKYHIITINEFKEFYPPISKAEQKELIVELSNSESYDDPYNWGSIIIDTDNYRNNTLEANSKEYGMKTDIIVQNVVKKYQERSEVGIKKYNTTLQENSDGVEVFLNHLQEELMDATLYIEKLKQQVKQLKDII